ncbi:hypothetical protein JXA32_12205 [Candidatus Sumerlaeota bacterium]|nr:hypothetical protein [Candidatus Sumerlaeota bacterium]
MTQANEAQEAYLAERVGNDFIRYVISAIHVLARFRRTFEIVTLWRDGIQKNDAQRGNDLIEAIGVFRSGFLFIGMFSFEFGIGIEMQR